MEQIVIDNYKDFLKFIEDFKYLEKKKTLLIHACCAPCSSEVLDLLSEYFDITIHYYNPNIYPLDEYEKRYKEFSKLPYKYNIIKEEYISLDYDEAVKGYENLGEFSLRCYKCFELRLEKTCILAKKENYDFFTTTLSISPYKKSSWINEIGYRLSEKYGVKYLYSDFKKQDGYKKSIALSLEYDLYRQHYCGCKYSLEECE